MDQYANFDLVIDRDGDSYVARVIDSPAGEASHEFDFPFSRLELENFLLRVGHARQTMRRIDSPQTEAARQFGGKLYDTVFGDEVKTCFRRALDEVDRQDPPQGLRVRIRFENALDMADLPWEFLYSKNLDEFLVHSTRTPLVRYIDLADRPRPLEVEPPIRILVMVSSPSDVIELNVEEEYERLANELDDLVQKGAVVIERLDEANLSSLQKKLRQYKPHIFHYIGHGGYDEARDDGVLMLEDERGRGQSVSGHELGTILRDHRSLRLAFLNSCEGARSSTTDPFAGTAQSLIRKGIPAVVAMQFEISDDAAIVFAHEFYAAVADGYAVDAATAEARKVMLGASGVEWATPVLTMRAPDGMIFKITGEAVPLKEQPPPAPVPTIEEPEPGASASDAVETAAQPENGTLTRAEAETAEHPGQSDTAERTPTGVVPGPTSAPVAPPTIETPEVAATAAPLVSPGPEQSSAPATRASQPPAPEPSTKRGVPTAVWIIAALLGAVVVLAIVGSLLPDDPPGGEAQGGADVEVLDETLTTDAAAQTTPVTPEEVFRPGEDLIADQIFVLDGEGMPTWDFEPSSIAFTDFIVHEDGWDGVSDLETDWIFGWDENFLYAQAFVTDDVYSQDAVGNQIYRGDSLNLDIDTDLDGDLAAVAPDADDFQLLVTAANANGLPEAWLFEGNGSIFVDAPRQGGTFVRVFLESDVAPLYTVEFRVAWSDLGMTPEPGMVLGFRVSANDNDVFELRQEVMYSNVAESTLLDVTSWGTLELG